MGNSGTETQGYQKMPEFTTDLFSAMLVQKSPYGKGKSAPKYCGFTLVIPSNPLISHCCECRGTIVYMYFTVVKHFVNKFPVII